VASRQPQDDFVVSAISDYLALGRGGRHRRSGTHQGRRYRTHTFFTVYAVTTTKTTPDDDSASRLDIHRISRFVLPRGLITVRLSPHIDVDTVSLRLDELGGQEYSVGSARGRQLHSASRAGRQDRPRARSALRQ
jgi:hypothetical protein